MHWLVRVDMLLALWEVATALLGLKKQQQKHLKSQKCLGPSLNVNVCYNPKAFRKVIVSLLSKLHDLRYVADIQWDKCTMSSYYPEVAY